MKQGRYMDIPQKFADMIKSDKYVLRVRGFRLFCRQARWDKDYVLDEKYRRGAAHSEG